MNSNLHESFLQLIRLGIGTGTVNGSRLTVHGSDDWQALKTLADEQGLSAVILDALNTDGMNLTDSIPLHMKLEWIGEVIQSYEQRYAAYEKAVSSLAGFYNQHGFKMMVLKGYACSLDWPKPEHRPCGDIDIWLFGQQEAADKELVSSLKSQDSSFKIDNSHHHHTVFYWQGFMVENHYDFVNVHHSKSNAEIEKVFKELGEDDSHYVEVSGEKVYLPSPNLHALFLLRHAMIEFAAGGINFRQILDWAFFVEKHGKDVDWSWLLNLLDDFHMREFFNCINAICVEEFGYDSKIFPYVQFNPFMKDKVLKDILEPEIPNDKPKYLLPRMIWKYRRWKANSWKHQLCYNESMWSAFWRGLWNHLLKPSSI